MQPTKEPVVAETYDEVVFTDPRETFFQQLMRVADLPKIASADQTVQECFQLFSDQDDFQKLIEAQRFLKKELEQVKARMRIVDDEMDQVDASLREVHEAKQRVSTAARATAVQQQKPKAAMAAPVRAPSPAKKAKVGS
jgi:methyl-accepting chemotaxis protein